MAEFDILYMQRHEFITGLPIVQPWKENDDDIEYMLATPKRKAADAMYEAVRKARQLASIATDWNLSEAEIDGEMVSVYDLLREFKAVLALADGDKGE